MSFNDSFPEPELSKGWLAVYFAAILGCWLFVSNADYQDARRDECERKSSTKFSFTYQPSTDTCIKEKRNGTTTQNR